MTKPVTAFVVIFDSAELLPHFLRHYDRLGVDDFVIGVGVRPDSDLFDVVRKHASTYNCHVYGETTSSVDFLCKDQLEIMMRAKHPVADNDYAMWLDLDEFHEYPAPLSEIVNECDRQDIWAIQAKFLDRVSGSGELTPIGTAPSIGSQYPMGCLLSERIGRCDPRKIMLCRGRVVLRSTGHHDTFVGEVDRWPVGAPQQYIVHHFKWNSTVMSRLAQRVAEMPALDGYAAECSRLLEFASTVGRINLEDPALQTRYCGAFRYFDETPPSITPNVAGENLADLARNESNDIQNGEVTKIGNGHPDVKTPPERSKPIRNGVGFNEERRCPVSKDQTITLDVENAADLVNCFVREQLPRIAYPNDKFAGRGIVIAAGGLRYLVNAWVAINMLRRIGCELPVECWYLGEQEISPKWAELARPLGVTCIDAHEVRQRQPRSWLHQHGRLQGWELKAYSIMHSLFKEVLLLDADNVPVRDPTYLFETPEYRQCGAIFWPDCGQLKPNRLAWKVFGDIPYRDEQDVESGQIVLDKQACWQCLVLCHWYMQKSDFYFRHVHGDKEVFHLAWRKLERPYAMPSKAIHRLPGVICQHDLQGHRVFQHRCMRKWQLVGNPATPDFQFEAECLGYLNELRQYWCPVEDRIGELSAADRDAMRNARGQYMYERVGYETRSIELDDKGYIGEGAGSCESYWCIKNGRLLLFGDEFNLTATLSQRPRRAWCGRWSICEQMQILLQKSDDKARCDPWHSRWSPVKSAYLALLPHDLSAMKAAAGDYRYERVGLDWRWLMLMADGIVDDGSAENESYWYIQEDRMFIMGKDGEVTSSLNRGDDGGWQGRWERDERIVIMLCPGKSRDSVARNSSNSTLPAQDQLSAFNPEFE